MSGSVGQYTQGWLPWMGSKTNTGFPGARTADSLCLGMGRLDSDSAQNSEFTDDIWLDAGTWKYAQMHVTVSNTGIYGIQLDGVSQGTIDGYSAATTRNVYSEITGISVTVAGLKTFKVIMATKNASSSAYQGLIQSCAWIRTSGTSSTPSGTDTPGYTWHYLPWMGSKSNTNWANYTQDSTSLGGGWGTNNGTQNSEINWDVWVDAGTYKVALVYLQNTDACIHSITGLNGTQTIDAYGAATARNTYAEVTGITVSTAGVKAIKDKAATKNASSSNYTSATHSFAIIRTGA